MLGSAQRLALLPWRFWILIPSIFIGIGLASIAGPLVERALFWVEYPQTGEVAYSIRAWLSAHRQEMPVDGGLPQFHSSAVGGWMILFMPLSAIASLYLMARYATHCSRAWVSNGLGPSLP